MSFIIELLSYDDTITDENAGNFYFEDLALCNEVIITYLYLYYYYFIILIYLFFYSL
jgi:hypothetical protein